MSYLSIACIILGCLYAFIRFPLAIVPRTTTKFLRHIFASNMSTRLFIVAWFIPWCTVVYSTSQLKSKTANFVMVWGIIGIIISLYVFIFPSKYRSSINRRLDEILSNSADGVALRLLSFMTAFLGVLLIHFGINVF